MFDNIIWSPAGATAAEPESEGSEDELPQVGFHDTLKSFATPAPKASGGKAKAKPKATSTPMPTAATSVPKAKATVKRKNQDQPDVATTSKLKKSMPKSKKRAAEEDCSLGMDARGPDDMKVAMDSDELPDPDRVTMDFFENKFAALKFLDPPLSDAAFKQYLQNVCSNITQMNVEIRTKRRSCLRRSGRENDPLYKALSVFAENVASFQQLVKCYLDQQGKKLTLKISYHFTW